MATATHLPTKLVAAEMRELLGLEPNAYLCDRITTFSCVWVRQSDEWWIKPGVARVESGSGLCSARDLVVVFD
jgi:hypothetical protein